ncbi:Pls/PosA family non-ribosomal peptide synthetase [Arthrobacter bambusae]|uniref:Pls/PosA family non-ribosomal peptide synthetase n=1 Tax=Arthrobacter bambusae TaxID=1338426 RepID=UPI002786B3AC|nr:Pls/PosA family non-ribosomal peptide synthetase [Arthrobacter bambusae]MDQ0030397.1 non-ribosomal peptide synthetase-like protein [Arthrobacter bambusae]MDQ0098314.1 non-ribosomal peptide synthetase-like protein [Arthrobacter bambusae]
MERHIHQGRPPGEAAAGPGAMIHLRDGAPVLLGKAPGKSIRWSPGERLEELFEDRCDRQRAEGRSSHPAVETAEGSLSYQELDARANRLARYLLARGVRPRDRIALLFDDPVRTYVSMLGVLKAHAVYVPLDPAFPSERIAYIAADADVTMILTASRLADGLPPGTAALAVRVDKEDRRIAAFDPARLAWAGEESPADGLAYIIYTSGSTGRPKGVAIAHASICHFVRTAAETYGYEPLDRVYQGMTTAFDFSVEEIWVPWMVGATLVPRPPGNNLLGPDLAEFIEARNITALCCVPTLLATLDDDVPGLRFLLVSGEACPEDLVERWHRPGRRFLNVYGPTEATVTATWGTAEPGKPVTLGKPLPGYSAVILDPVQDRALPHGELGEIGLAGVGLARGYINRPELTERAFIPDFLGLEDNPSHRIYRTGDLGRFNEHDEIEYHGRTDTQVKVRGYRIELSEIESVLLQRPGIAMAVVKTWEPEPGITELAAYYTLRQNALEEDGGDIRAWLRERLPAYMVPGYFQPVRSMPMMVSGKVDRSRLPPPAGPRAVSTDVADTMPVTPTERTLAPALAAALQLASVSTTANFFNDLGANSLLMAHFCANVRKVANAPSVSMREIYAHPTIAALAAALDAAHDRASALSAAEGTETATAEPYLRVGTPQYLLCGLLQALASLLYAYVVVLIPFTGEQWIGGSRQPGVLLARSAVVGTISFLALAVMPIALKWALIGRWKPAEFPIWSLRYVRFWFVKTLVNTSPLRLFVGTPVFPLYLRALGARIGPRVTILSSRIPACTDLLTVGGGTVIRRDTTFNCYRAQAGRIQTGPVTLGSNVLIGEQSTLDIDTAMGDDSQLGHSSCLHRFQAVPPGGAWAGSPAEPTDVSYRRAGRANSGPARRASFSFWSLLVHMVLVSSIGLGAIDLVLASLPAGETNPARPLFWQALLLISAVLLFGSILAAFALAATLPRLLALLLAPGKDYPLYSFRFGLFRTAQRLTNLKALLQLTGDSSLIVYYLNVLGYHQPDLVQTGSNFGVGLKHDSPTLTTVGSGTMVSDGLSIIHADYSNTAFRLSPAVIGARSFFGNNIAYPAGARIGDNCLLGTKTMVPLEGPLREGVGLLGSPPFEIPRTVDRDSTFDRFRTPEERARRIPAKNLHNTVTVIYYLLARWAELYVILLTAWASQAFLPSLGALAALAAVGTMVITTGVVMILVEWASLGFRRLSPTFCSIYEVPFWRHERYWKLGAGGIVQMFNGTPFKAVIWRILGARMGKKVFDDGCGLPEKTLVTIGDYCTLNAYAVAQCHSMEDGTFKLDAVNIGAGCTLGVSAFVHYGTTMNEGSVLEADSFLMKGEDVPAHSVFGGNPARELSRQAVPGLP